MAPGAAPAEQDGLLQLIDPNYLILMNLPSADEGEFLKLPCDVLVPAALGHVINGDVARGLQCKVRRRKAYIRAIVFAANTGVRAVCFLLCPMWLDTLLRIFIYAPLIPSYQCLI